MIGANFLSGANSRLLPASIPFRFFTAAAICYALFWAALFVSADDITSYVIGGGPILGLIHMATLGVLTMTVIGASLQLLSVATRRAFSHFWICRLLSWIYIPGFILLTGAMYVNWPVGMLYGAGLTGIGLLIFCGLITDNIRNVKGMAAIMTHCWAAMLSLLGLVGLGILLIMDMEQGFMADHLTIALSHFILAVFGFMSLLAMGFSYILVPMFCLAPAPPEMPGRLSVACNMTGIILALAGLNLYLDWLTFTGILLGLIGVGVYIFSMIRVYGGRMRKRLGVPFVLIRVAWFILPLSLVWAAVGAAGFWPELWPESMLETGHILFAVLAIIGWLLTFLVGILQRILPFLSSMHASGLGGVPMLMSDMADERLLSVNAIGHMGGFFLVATGVIFDMDIIIRAGAVIGFIGAVGLLIYLMSIIRHLLAHQSEKVKQ
ncbi:hypothetical protein MNBD_ALPHA01-1476 [hydrothermal vent metagenome]|uniref:NnrS protein involved in response to NO n=1 Tax=hydrothermal vent metagenome TaxID=652676 RepID=A0A3B0RVX5_9ZZZZ